MILCQVCKDPTAYVEGRSLEWLKTRLPLAAGKNLSARKIQLQVQGLGRNCWRHNPIDSQRYGCTSCFMEGESVVTAIKTSLLFCKYSLEEGQWYRNSGDVYSLAFEILEQKHLQAFWNILCLQQNFGYDHWGLSPNAYKTKQNIPWCGVLKIQVFY